MGDYTDWIAFQRTAGGLPANFFGYLAMIFCRLITRHNLRNPASIPGDYSVDGKYLNSNTVPKRDPPTAKTDTDRWPVPQRQYEDPSEEMKTAIEQFTERFATDNNLVEGTAYDSLNAYYLDGVEVFHRHPKDYSHHVMLHPSDAKLLLVLEWGELFGLAGKVGQKLGTVLVFAPRSTEEIKVLETIFKGAMEYAKKGKAS
jgi:hypothetical protein